MPRRETPAQVQECPVCQFRADAPIPQTIWCPHRHTNKRKQVIPVQLTVIWSKADGGEPPSRKAT